jgi:hypothetical protein
VLRALPAQKNSRRPFPSGNFTRLEKFPVKKIFVQCPRSRAQVVFRGEIDSSPKYFSGADEFVRGFSLSTQKVTENLQKLPEF